MIWRFLSWVGSGVTGILLVLCFPPWNQTWLGWVALTPLAAILFLGPLPTQRPWLGGAILGYLAGLVFFWGAFFWLTTVSGLGWFLLAFYLALYPALWGAFVAGVLRPTRAEERLDGVAGARLPAAWMGSFHNLQLAFLAATAWTAQEWLRGIVFTGFGWNSLGVALHDNLPLIQIADLTGVGGLSFLLAFVNVMIILCIGRFMLEIGRTEFRPHYDFTLTLGMVALVFAYGVRAIDPPGPAAEIHVVAVQPDIPQVEKWDPAAANEILRTYRDLSEQAAALQPDLLLWPEAATPGALFNDRSSFDAVQSVAEMGEFNFLLGSIHYDVREEEGEILQEAFNVAVMLDRSREEAQIYRKIHLVPFGEYVPLRHSFPLFAWVVGDLIPSDFDAGDEFLVLQMQDPELGLAPLICFEDTIGRLVRRFCLADDVHLLVNLTNDGWFLRSSGSQHHLINSIFRTVETRRPMVRVANTGVSCVIDPSGRISAILRDEDGSTFTKGLLSAKVRVPLQPPETFYVRHGELFSRVMLALSLLVAILIPVWRWKR